jgi:hypothetical protein
MDWGLLLSGKIILRYVPKEECLEKYLNPKRLK